jgi:hypothetical protein
MDAGIEKWRQDQTGFRSAETVCIHSLNFLFQSQVKGSFELLRMVNASSAISMFSTTAVIRIYSFTRLK